MATVSSKDYGTVTEIHLQSDGNAEAKAEYVKIMEQEARKLRAAFDVAREFFPEIAQGRFEIAIHLVQSADRKLNDPSG